MTSGTPGAPAITELLGELHALGMRLWSEGGSLRYEAPRGALTPELRERLRDRKEEVLAFLRSAEVEADLPPIRRAGPGVQVASFQQERLWFLAQLAPESRAYNIPAALRLEGPLDRRALAAAIHGVVRRHEALRTRFSSDGLRPRPEVEEMPAVLLPRVDLSALPEAAREREAARLVAEEELRAFDLRCGPLFRASLLELRPDAHVLLLHQHHVVSDRWSVALLLDELNALYPAAVDGKGGALPGLPIQYLDYAAWQRGLFESGALGGHLDYWRKQLGGELPVLELPMARPRPSSLLLRGAGHDFRLPVPLALELKRLGAREGTTQFILLLAAFKVLLHRYSEQVDILVGTPVANRTRPETERLIGFFANMLVLRSDLSGNPSFRQFLGRVRQVSLAAYDHQDLPFEKLVEEINPERDLARNPLFQVVFVLNSDPMPELRLPGVASRRLAVGTQSAKFDLMLALQEDADGIEGLVEYSADLFGCASIDRMAGHFRILLEGLAADPVRPIGELPLLSPGERQQILVDWNCTVAPFGEGLCIHQLFEVQAARTPGAVAAIHDGRTITYGELNRAANRLAHRLRREGIGTGDLVGVCLARSLEMLIGLVAVLKSGAAYVPLDPGYPEERQRYILESTGVPLVLSCGGAYRGSGFRVIDLDQEAPPPGGEEDPACGAGAGDLAYIIFTSGSTGRPKGVVLQHRPVVNLIEWVNHRFGVGPGDRLLFMTSLCFDLSVYDIFGMLAAGGEVYVASDAELADPARLAEVLAGGGITFWDSAPAALQQLVPFFGHAAGAGTALRLVFLSGDWVPLSLPPAVQGRFPNAHVVALGGATEAAIWSNFYTVDAIDPEWKSVPYGMPIQNARYYTLDAHLGLSPIDVPGDLYIGGRCLSLGYFGQPALTAERYIPDPFSPEPGAVLYNTGDRARRMPDGNLEFLGRRDTQVKIRGFRIELGEIEAVLRGHSEVREAVVLAREDRRGDRRLVAYVEPVQGGDLDGLEAALLAEVRAALPDYMLPAAFVFLDAWPVTGNGKLDRRALPAPEAAKETDGHVPPSTPIELRLAEIWGELLGVGELGTRDNFFRLGGHSLLATQAVSAIRSQLGIELSLRELFTHPTIAALAGRIDELGEAAVTGEPPLSRVPRTGDLPLSFAQERLWFLDRLQPDSAVYNISGAMKLSGVLDRPALARSFQTIVDRHEPLRTLFPECDGRPSQVIQPRLAHAMPVVDLAALPAAVCRAETQRLAGADASLPFDLRRGPMLRTTLLALEPREHVLLVCVHHIAADAWSVGVILRELSACYRACLGGGSPTLPELPVDYVDYAFWQRRRLEGEGLERQMEYWKERLAGAPPVLELPTDRPRPNVFRFRGRMQAFILPAELLAAVERLRGGEDATRFMLLLTAFQVLLARYTGETDILVGSPVANRDRAELEGLVGFFVNTLVIRTELGGNPSFRGLVARTRAAALAAYDHQELPFEKLVEEINPDRDLSRNPLFQVVLMVQNAPALDQGLPGVSLAVLPLENQTAKFDITVDLTEESGILRGLLEYNADIFLPATMQRLVGHYRALLERLTHDPDRPVFELPLLTEAEAWQVVAEWNDTAAPYSRDLCLHSLFERQAASSPERRAAVCGRLENTYGELNRRANRLAHFLVSRGIGPGSLVGVCLSRSLDMPVALLGILKAGGAYVPVDPAYPRERIRHILAQTGAGPILTQTPLAHLFGECGEEIVCLDRETFGDQPESNLGPRAEAGDLAYIIFTSGSTGRPKGVALQHRPVVNLVEWVNATFGVGPADRLLFITSLCFDLSVYDLFGVLAAGGTVHVATEAELEDPARLVAVLDDGGITFWDSAPAALQRLLPFLPPPGAGSRDLRLVFLSGDWIPLSLSPAMTASFPNARVISLGGATEAAIWSNVFPVLENRPEWRSVPYGRPIRNARYHVLDPAFHPCPIGVPGALYIGGECLSFGYFRQSDLTAVSHVPDPFSPLPGGVLYATGDRARWLPDGNLEFLGRADDQVKIRGFRIEPGEVESALREHPAVREAVVVVRDDRRGERQLVAFVKTGPEAPAEIEPLARALRTFLKCRIPEYMVPALFGRVDEWPVTANGKLDRKALPQEGVAAGFVAETVSAAARTPVEEMLAGIWVEVLSVPEVGIHDNFFELGGHSILVTQLASRLRRSFGVEIPLRRLFDHPTVAELAALLAEAQAEGRGALAPITPIPGRVRAPLSHAQERVWLEHQLNPVSAAYNVPFAMRMRGLLDPDALGRSLSEIVRRHALLRTTFEVETGGPLQVVQPARSVLLPVVDLAALDEGARESEARRLADAEALIRFDLGRSPLLRTLLVRLDRTHHVLVVNVHHIAFDGWSISVFFRELSVLYQAFLSGETPSLPDLPLQYGDYAAWQREHLDGQGMSDQLAFWKRKLDGAPPFLELPVRRPRPLVMSGRGGSATLALTREQTGALRDLSRRQDCTLFMTLTAAFEVLLHQHTQTEDLVIGTDVAGRSRAELEGLIGFFVNQVALRVSLAGNPDFSQILERVRQALLEAYAHQEVPFNKVVEALNPPRDRSRPPVVQVKIGLQGAAGGPPSLQGLNLSEYPVGGHTAKFDLWLNLWEEQGRLLGRLEYNRDVVSRGAASKLLRQYELLLADLGASGHLTLAALSARIASYDVPAAAENLAAARASLFARKLLRKSSQSSGETA